MLDFFKGLRGGKLESSAQRQFKRRVVGAGVQSPIRLLLHQAHGDNQAVAADFRDQSAIGINAQPQQLKRAACGQVCWN
jgi:hypothetical protein